MPESALAIRVEDWLFRAGIITATHSHEEGQGILSPDCAGCLEEAVRRKPTR